MNKEVLFAQTLEQVRKTAKEQGNCISEEQVKDAFAELDLSGEQLQMVFDYLLKRKIGIGQPMDPDEFLTEEEKKILCNIALEIRPDFIKTSTGFGTGGATLEDVKLMKSIVGDAVKVKAAGGIRDLDTCLAMVEAGAERIGTSAAVKITEEFIARG